MHFPRGTRVPVTLSGDAGAGTAGVPGRRSVPRALRFRLEPRLPPPSASPVACLSRRDPLRGPPRAPSPLLGLAAALRSVRRSAGSSFGSSSGPARAPAPARMPWRSGWAGASRRSAWACCACRGGAHRRGRVERTRTRVTRTSRWRRSPGPCPALPCRSPASPPVAVSAPPLAPPSPSWVLLGGGAASRSQLGDGGGAARVMLRWGRGGGGSAEPRPSAHSQPDTHTAVGGGGRAARRPRDAGRLMSRADV